MPYTKHDLSVDHHPLTEREMDILVEIANGYMNKEIARIFGTQLSTVKNQVTTIFNKMNVLTRTEAVAEAIHRGWIKMT